MKAIASNGMEINTGDAVLVRNNISEKWKYSIFSHTDSECGLCYYKTTSIEFKYCIPYKGNEYLVGTNDGFIVPKKSLTYEEKQKRWVKKHNIKVGDKVKLIKESSLGENGWKVCWIPYMNSNIGKTGVIIEISYSSICISFNNQCAYCYPYHVLRKVEDTIKFKFGARVRGYDKKAKKEKIGILIDQHRNKYARYRVAYPLNDEEGETDWFPNIEYLVHK